MSVRTAADEKLDEARESVQTAISALGGIVIGEQWGHDEYNPEFRKQLNDAFDELRAVREKLK